MHGVVCSALEARLVKENCGKDFICLCPGIRPDSYKIPHDQSRVLSPAEAAREGADFMVVGRPVTLAENPLAAAADIARAIAGSAGK
jgi:orotidine-5'-phosphate decarboxylase